MSVIILIIQTTSAHSLDNSLTINCASVQTSWTTRWSCYL